MITFLKNNIVAILSLITLGLLAHKYLDKSNENDRLHTDLINKTSNLQKITKYSDDLKREYLSQDDLKKKLTEEWKVEEQALKGRIKVLSDATFLIRQKARDGKSSDITYSGTTMKYVINELRFENGPAVGYVLIFSDGRVVSKIYDHEIDVKTAISRNESTGNYDVLSKADYVLKSPTLPATQNWFDKPYPLDIKGGVAYIDPTENNAPKRFFLWSPRLNGAIELGPTGITPGLGVSFMGYGTSPRDLDLKFLQIGTDYSSARGPGLTFVPVLYRPFTDALPNTYVGPGIAEDKDGQRLFFEISIGF